MSVAERIFVGWDGPLLDRLARWLMDRYTDGREARMGRTIVIVPSSRAMRWLEGALVDVSSERGALLEPPRIVPMAHAIEHLHPASRPPALARVALWSEALRNVTDAAEQLSPGASGEGAWAWAEALDATAMKLEREGLWFTDALERATVLDEEDRARLHACVAIGREWLRAIEHAGYAASSSIATDTCDEVVLAFLPELGGATRNAIATCARLTSIVAAPASFADRFDAYGIPLPSAWIDADAPIASTSIRFATDPVDQAHAAWECVAGLEGTLATRDVVIGAVDRASASAIVGVAREQGVRVRDGAGTALVRTAPGALLDAIAAHLRTPSLDTLGMLVRHPDVEEVMGPGARGAWWLDRLDEYAQRVPTRGLPSRAQDLPDATEREVEGMRYVMDAVGRVLGDLADGGARPMRAWGACLLGALGRIYEGRTIDERTPRGRALATALNAVRDRVRDIAPIGGVRCRAHECVERIASSVSTTAVPPAPDEDAIELLGWLELATDPSPVCVVCDVCEGRVPSRVGVDPLLPPKLVAAMGLPTDEDRAGRDAYLCALLTSSKGSCYFVSPSMSAVGDPLTPSRLLFRSANSEVLARLDRCSLEVRDPVRTVRLYPAAPAVPAEDGFLAMPTVEREIVVERWPVTSFRTYLASPYAFYIERALRLREVDEGAGELDPGSFGTLIHDTLQRFGDDASARFLEEEEAVASALGTLLSTVAREKYGADPPMPVWVQIEQARLRLRRFARAQAGRVRAGWRIAHTEWSPEEGAPLGAPENNVLLTGRIDRIDRNEETGAYEIIDYKTSAKGDKPDTTHRTKREKRWVDLQLPLYRALARSLGVGDNVGLGYALLPTDTASTGFAFAPWTMEELDDAERCALGVVRAVREGWMDEEGDTPPTRGVLGTLMGYGLIAGAGGDYAEGDGA